MGSAQSLQKPADEAFCDASDEQLFEACREGDQRAFQLIMRRHGGLVRRLAMNILHDEQEAEDVAQETFVAVWKARETWRPDAKLTTWLHRVAVNKAIDRYRSRRHTPMAHESIVEIVDAARDTDEAPDQHLALERRDLTRLMQTALARLPESQRRALVLFYFDNLDVEQIAVQMLTSELSVRSLLKRGRKALQTRLQKEKAFRGFAGDRVHPATGRTRA